MTDYEELKAIIDEIDVLIQKGVDSEDPCFQAWRIVAERFLIKKFGENKIEHTEFKNTLFGPSCYSYLEGTSRSVFVVACKKDLEMTKILFLRYLEEMQSENIGDMPSNSLSVNSDFKKVFIVHGHDEKLKQTVARIIEKQGIEAVILSEQVNQGRTIIEKFEDYSDVCGAICLFSADDVGSARVEATEKPRARQNVVLETGYFMGKLGRNRIVILADEGIEMPSDLSGIVHTDTKNWQFDLLKELKAMGYPIDFNKQF